MFPELCLVFVFGEAVWSSAGGCSQVFHVWQVRCVLEVQMTVRSCVPWWARLPALLCLTRSPRAGPGAALQAGCGALCCLLSEDIYSTAKIVSHDFKGQCGNCVVIFIYLSQIWRLYLEVKKSLYNA